MRTALTRVLVLATMAATACGAVGGGVSGGGGMGAPGGGGGAGMGGGGAGGGVEAGWGNGGAADVGLAGNRFEVVFVNGDGDKKASSIQFEGHNLSCAFLARWHVDSLAYTDSQHGRRDSFTASIADDAGNSLKFAGTLQGNAISGTLDVHKAADDKDFRFKFHGGLAGTGPADQADKEAQNAVAANK